MAARGPLSVAEPVMVRVNESAGSSSDVAVLLHDVRKDREEISESATTANVMLRVRGIASTRNPHQTSLRALSIARMGRSAALVGGGIAAAAALFVAVWWPFGGPIDNGGNSHIATTGADSVEKSALPVAASFRLPSGQVRFGRELNGRRVWLLSTGAIQGVRVGDRLTWSPSSRGDWTSGGHFQVTGVSPFHAWGEFTPDTSVGADVSVVPSPGDWVAMAESDPAAQRVRAIRQVETAPLLGLGVILNHARVGDPSVALTVADVIPAYWWPGEISASLTPAGAAGLQAGDKLVGLMDQAITNLDDLARIAESRDLPTHGLEFVVERNGRRITLRAP